MSRTVMSRTQEPSPPAEPSNPPAAHRRRGGRRGRSASCLDTAQDAFDLLVAAPRPLALEGAGLGRGLPARLIPLNELRELLLRRGTPTVTRDTAWRELVHRSRSTGNAWTVGAVGVALPALRALARALSGGPAHHGNGDGQDVDAEVLTGFLEALKTVNVAWSHLPLRLRRMTKHSVLRARRPSVGEVLVAPEVAESMAPPPVYGHPDLLLADAVRQGVIGVADAEMIGETRLDRVPLSVYAAQVGLGYWQALKRRQRAEHRLVQAIRDGRVRTRIT